MHKLACPNCPRPHREIILDLGYIHGHNETRKRPINPLEKSSGPLVQGISESWVLNHDPEGQPRWGKPRS